MQLSYSVFLLYLRIATFSVFLGRAYQHIFWDAPYRSFFWDESLLQPVIEKIFSIPWYEYVTDLKTDATIQMIIKGNGFLYAVAAACTLFIHKRYYKYAKLPILIGGVSLVLLSVLLTKEKFYHTAQFFEHSLQFGTPFVFLMVLNSDAIRANIILVLKVLTAVTFASHGLYALGFYPVPGNFIDMLIKILGVSEATAIQFLYIAGILDFVIAILIFVPVVSGYVLGYAFLWGLLTALARIVSDFNPDFMGVSLHQSLYLTIYRLPHAIIPLLLMIYERRLKYKMA